MAGSNHIPFWKRAALFTESIFMAFLVPKERVGRFYRIFFKFPLLLQRVGLGALMPRNVLILTTTGRRTGLPRHTPVEYSPGPGRDVYFIMSGWDGHTDWYKNVRANPCVKVWLAGREWEAVAEPVPDRDVARLLKELTRLSPSAARMWSRWSDTPIDGSDESYQAAAPHFPPFYLKPKSNDRT